MSTQKIRHILLIPEDGDPYGLLRAGVVVSRPPVVQEWNPGEWSVEPSIAHSWLIRERGEAYGTTKALALAWEGDPVPEGWFRAALIELRAAKHKRGHVLFTRTSAAIEDVLAMARDLEEFGRGRLEVVYYED